MTERALISRIDLDSPVPVYQQLADGIRAELVAGRLRPGAQLPTVRQLALDLGIHHNTVAEAYRVLAAEGWLDLRRGRGAMVIERRPPAPTAKAQADFAQRLHELTAKALSGGVPKSAAAAALNALVEKLAKGDSR